MTDLDTLQNHLEGYSERVRAQLPHVSNAFAVGNSLINSLLDCIGWPSNEPARVRVGFGPSDSKPALAYSLLDRPDEPHHASAIIVLLVNEKDATLRANDPPQQLQHLIDDAPPCGIGAWTNGAEWYWYRADESGTLGPTPFVSFDVSTFGWWAPNVLQWLRAVQEQYDRPSPDEMSDLAQSLAIESRLQVWWNKAKSNPPPALLEVLLSQMEINALRRDDALLSRVKSAWIQLHGRSQSHEVYTPRPTNDQLVVADGQILDRLKSRQRAWRIKDHASGKWLPWKVEQSGVAVQVAVAEWLVGLNRDGMYPLLESSARRRLASPGGASLIKPKWHPICDGTAYMFCGFSNPNRKGFLLRLAARITDIDDRTPTHGRDFELWLPGGAKKGSKSKG